MLDTVIVDVKEDVFKLEPWHQLIGLEDRWLVLELEDSILDESNDAEGDFPLLPPLLSRVLVVFEHLSPLDSHRLPVEEVVEVLELVGILDTDLPHGLVEVYRWWV